MAAAESFEVEVVYALPHDQRLMRVMVSSGTTLEQAVRQSGLLDEFPEIDLRQASLGVFGRKAAASDAAKPGDRVEVYRALTVDPKTIRRLRALSRERRR